MGCSREREEKIVHGVEWGRVGSTEETESERSEMQKTMEGLFVHYKEFDFH